MLATRKTFSGGSMKKHIIKKWLLSALALVVFLSVWTYSASKPVGATNTRTIRLHFSKGTNITDESVWTWGDVLNPSSSWPNGEPMQKSDDADYPYYSDIEMIDNPKYLNFLVVKPNDEKRTDDISIEIISDQMNDIYLDDNFNVHYTKDRVPKGQLRIHYLDEEFNYIRDHFYGYGLLNINGSNSWGTFLKLEQSTLGKNGVYGDLDLDESQDIKDTKTGFFALVPSDDGHRSYEYVLSDIPDDREVFVREGDTTIYDNPYYVLKQRMTGAERIGQDEVKVSFNDISKYSISDLEMGMKYLNGFDEVEGFQPEITLVDNAYVLRADFGLYGITHLEMEGVRIEIMKSWKYIDSEYAYEGDLGATLHPDGSATLKVWSPSAESVNILLYDKDDQVTLIKTVPMNAGDSGVWEQTLNADNTGIQNHNNYVYHYEIVRDDKTFIVLDPYAKSLAQWNQENEQGDKVAKAAIVNPSSIGQTLDYANIDGYETREDAIIYELHVRDFTSDPNLEGTLESQFGTFSAFVEKLDYIQDLGITHIQLLPIMSYYYANEANTAERMLEYESSNTDYNWGYDPQAYFALTGMYSEDPGNPEKRIEEFKNLVNEIHERGMGVILDVVYNHTARLEIFEDLEPNYYHFMDADGTPRTSFGGGRLGTSHYMSRRVLVDSITYLVDEYKVDGFRFDMMGDHDAETIQIAFDEAKKLNPNILMIGEGWITYAGDENEPLQPADQNWMQYTQAVGSFSDEIRNELKSGFGSEGQPRFLTNGPRSTQLIYSNMIARPNNFLADDPGDVVQYIEAHDNLTLYDVIAQSIKKDPSMHDEEILKRVRMGNTMILTAQGTSFLHGGQEYGRTKQFLAETDEAPYKSTYMTSEDGTPFKNPYFIHDSYDSSDIINRFDWDKATNSEQHPLNVMTRNQMKGMIAIRRSTDAFSYPNQTDIDEYVSSIASTDILDEDLILAMKNISEENGDIYYTFVNADSEERVINFTDESIDIDLSKVISNGDIVSLDGLEDSGVIYTDSQITLKPLSTVIIKVSEKEDTVPPVVDPTPIDPVVPNPDKPVVPGDKLPATGVSNNQIMIVSGLLVLAGALILLRKRKVN